MPEHPYLWHPIFVHFTVALLIVAAFFYAAAALTKNEAWRPRLLNAGELNLWVGAALSTFTVALGAIAYGTVPHDDVAHEAMLAHRAWGLIAFAIYALLALLSIWHRKHRPYPSLLFAIAMLVGLVALGEAGLRGGQLVFEHGLGVDERRNRAADAPAASNRKDAPAKEAHDDHHHDHHH